VYIPAEKRWYILAENEWYILAENRWSILAENRWYIAARKLTILGKSIFVTETECLRAIP
jgi:hypothetical protein